jgi:lipid-binding SYLF domain-containing protein
MASLGANLGAGVQFYQSVFLFETESAFNSFITSGWEANTAADAAFGKAGAAAEVKFNGGMAFYHLAESGALVSASVAGTKYWVSEDLNKKG